MANRYWVGGSNTWNSTVGTKWSATSGGAGGATLPGDADLAIFDGNSGSVAVTTSGLVNCGGLTFAGFTGSISLGNTIRCKGNLTFGSGGTYTGSGQISMTVTSTLTPNNANIGFMISMANLSATFTVSSATNVNFLSSGGLSVGATANLRANTLLIKFSGAPRLIIGESLSNGTYNIANTRVVISNNDPNYLTGLNGLISMLTGTGKVSNTTNLNINVINSSVIRLAGTIGHLNLSAPGTILIVNASPTATINNLTLNASTTIKLGDPAVASSNSILNVGTLNLPATSNQTAPIAFIGTNANANIINIASVSGSWNGIVAQNVVFTTAITAANSYNIGSSNITATAPSPVKISPVRRNR